MGWKSLRDHYDITHLLQVTSSGIVIGSPYIPDIVTIDTSTGVVSVDYIHETFLSNNYPILESAPPDEILALLAEEDQFEQSIPVFTYEGAEIHELLCEKPGYPNLTHDGFLMYDNMFSTDRKLVAKWAIDNAIAEVEWAKRDASNCRTNLANAEARLAHHEQVLAQLSGLR